jgi:phosphate transport system substrate-binding protein
LASKFQQISGARTVVRGTLGQEVSLLEGKFADLVIVSRDLSSQNPKLTVRNFAYDRSLVVVNDANPLEEITRAQMGSLYEGEVDNWHQLGNGNLKVQVMTREPGSRIRETFESEFLPEDAGNLSLKALAVNSNAEMRSAISSIRGAIGYLSVGALSEEVKPIRVMRSGREIESPRIDIYATWLSSNDKPMLETFVEFLDSQAARSIIADHGLKTDGKASN